MRIIITLIALLILHDLKSQNAQILGGNIRYEHINNRVYKIIGSINRNCSGPSLNTPTLKIFSNNQSFNINLTRTSIKNITNKCSNIVSCENSNSPSADGIEQHQFEATIDFNQSPYNIFLNNNNCEVYFGLSSDKRSDSITNISKNSFYVEAMLNFCVLGNDNNSSSKGAEKEINVFSLNLSLSYTFLSSDRDQDELNYQLVKAETEHLQFETYNIPLTEKIPVYPFCPPNPGSVNCRHLTNAKPPRGFFHDSTKGDVILTPTVKGYYIVCNRIFEYRTIQNKKYIVGYSTREQIFNISLNTKNNPPYFSGVNYKFICEGDSIVFNIQSKDDPFLPNQTIADSTYLTWENNIPNSSIIITNPNEREKNLQFMWRPKIGDANSSPYHFIVYASDNNCFNNSITYKSMFLYVINKPKADISISRINSKGIIFDDFLISNTNQQYNWTIKNIKDSILFTSTRKTDSFEFANYGTYYIQLNVLNPPHNCETRYLDTFELTKLPTNLLQNFKIKASVYPNPSNGNFYIESENFDEITALEVIDVSGRTILNLNVQKQVNITELKSGLYFLKITSANSSQLYKIIRN